MLGEYFLADLPEMLLLPRDNEHREAVVILAFDRVFDASYVRLCLGKAQVHP